MLPILTGVTLGQLHRHRTMSVGIRGPSNGVKADFLKPQGMMSSKAILAKTKNGPCLKPVGEGHHPTARDPPSELFRVPTMQPHSGPGTL